MNALKHDLQAFFALVESLEKIPAVGKKSAQKIAHFLGVEDKFLGLKVAHALENAVRNLGVCRLCNSMSEGEICGICADSARQNGQLCVVLSPKDIFTIESVGVYHGRYFVVDGEAVDFELMASRVVSEGVREIIFALTPSVANDSMALFMEDRLRSILADALESDAPSLRAGGATASEPLLNPHVESNSWDSNTGAETLSWVSNPNAESTLWNPNASAQLLDSKPSADLLENLVFTKIAHGVPTGVGFDSIDQNSLSSAFTSRTKI